jgi:predicted acylesterase/phospholipase RssA
LKPNELEYFYQEPLKKRNKKISGKHLSLALQGGGCKGVSYIGAYQALKEYYGDSLPIKSIIGSSAGGILGLAICCQLSDE